MVWLQGEGTLTECLGGADDLSCRYAALAAFTGQVSFTYKANDGVSDSLNAVRASIKVVPPNPEIVDVALGASIALALCLPIKKLNAGGDYLLELEIINWLAHKIFGMWGAMLRKLSLVRETCFLLEGGQVKCGRIFT